MSVASNHRNYQTLLAGLLVLFVVVFALVSCKQSGLLTTTEVYKVINLSSSSQKMTLQTRLDFYTDQCLV